MKRTANNQLERAISMAEIFRKFKKTDLSVREFCRKEGIHTSKLYYWKERFRQEGREGLGDRRQGNPHKAIETVRQYIQDVKKRDPLKSGSDISKLIEKRFNKEVSDHHIQRIRKDMGLNDPVVRKTGKPIKKTTNH